MKIPIDLLIFDLDGTLVDSKSDIATAVNLTLDSFGIPAPSSEIIEKHIGTGIRPLIEAEMRNAGIADLAGAVEKFNGFYLDNLTVSTAPFEGVTEVLKHYSNSKKVVLTNKMNLFAMPLLSQLGMVKYFDGIYGRESFASFKPDPIPILEISKLHNAPLERIVIIGDTEADIIAGQRAGIKTCAVTYGFGKQEDLMKLNPSLVIHKPIDLVDCFEESV